MAKKSDAAANQFGIHWFRRDLRVAGNPALRRQCARYEGRVLGLFCFDSLFLSRGDFSHNRFAFFLDSLQVLAEELRGLGGDLLVVDALPQQVFPKIVKHFHGAEWKLGSVTFNRDYEPFARRRDAEILEILGDLKVETETFRDHLVIEPEELFKAKPGDSYQVFSPFAKKWFQLFHSAEIRQRIEEQKKGLAYLESKSQKKIFNLAWAEAGGKKFPFKDALDDFISQNNKSVSIEIPKGGSKQAYKHLKEFASSLKNYATDRDFPAVDGTSKMSLFLKNGSITTLQIISALNLKNIIFTRNDSPGRYLKELVWREFYYHVLYHRPDVEKGTFLAKYKDLKWSDDKKLFKRWCEGTTGFPIVDAGMRQLNTTGWMHNRVRMIVASFLCKDLLINWQWGENYFMKMLLDGDLAPNNGGWQWAASTGCDPQPYFRVFNPWLQGEKFDPEGAYIKTYVPELRNVPAKNLHDPEADRGTYSKPIVDHRVQKIKAIEMYKV